LLCPTDAVIRPFYVLLDLSTQQLHVLIRDCLYFITRDGLIVLVGWFRWNFSLPLVLLLSF
jgi:hypothetical protein